MKKILLIIIVIFSPKLLLAQSDTWHYSAEAQGIATPANKLPFWFRSGQYGSVPSNGTSASLIGTAYKNYDTVHTTVLNWAAGVNLRANVGSQSALKVIEAYAKIKYGIIELKAGRSKDITGLVDSTLSSGSFSVSGNALGIPKIGLSMPQYYTIPILKKLFAFKANYEFGFLGSTQLNQDVSLINTSRTYYQQNALYVRVGQPLWKLKLYGGINHNVVSGNERGVFGPNFTLSPVQALFYAAIGKTYIPPAGASNYFELRSKVGNHIGSVDMGLQYEFTNTRLFMYHQMIYDAGAIANLSNLSDGISGISLTNKNWVKGRPTWHKVLFELVYTKNQSGSYNAKARSGDEDYYNNYEYVQGWSYQGLNLGNPLIASRAYTRAGLINDPHDYFINNRIMAFHVAMEAEWRKIQIVTRLTYSQNFGTYGTSAEGHSTGTVHYTPLFGLFEKVNQFSGYVEAGKSFYNKLSGAIAIGYDNGGLYYNTLGVQLKLKKIFI